MMLLSCFQHDHIEAGCDEAGRGCLAGPVFAAAVIFKADFRHEVLNDSKKLKPSKRMELRDMIMNEAVDFSIASLNAAEIDQHNIHRASYYAMHRALDMLSVKPLHLLIDGNKFIPYQSVSHTCIVQGDGKYLSIAAASILAKTERDLYMDKIAEEFPVYGWTENKGYPTVQHRMAILQHGLSPFHRRSFKVTDPQLKLF